MLSDEEISSLLKGASKIAQVTLVAETDKARKAKVRKGQVTLEDLGL